MDVYGYVINGIDPDPIKHPEDSDLFSNPVEGTEHIDPKTGLMDWEMGPAVDQELNELTRHLSYHYRLDDASRRSDVNRLLHLVLEAKPPSGSTRALDGWWAGFLSANFLRGWFLDESSRAQIREI